MVAEEEVLPEAAHEVVVEVKTTLFLAGDMSKRSD